MGQFPIRQVMNLWVVNSFSFGMDQYQPRPNLRKYHLVVTHIKNSSVDSLVLIRNHGVPLVDLSVEAISIDNLDKEFLHLLKFYEQPENWLENAERLDLLCEKSNGVFSKRSVELDVQGVKNYMEYDEVITNWK